MPDLVTVSIGALLAISLVAVGALVVQMVALQLAARKPSFENPKQEQMPFGVRGGRFQAAGGRGATVHWGAPVFPDEPADQPAAVNVPAPRLDRAAGPGARTEEDSLVRKISS